MECVYVSLLLHICLDLYVTPKCCTLLSQEPGKIPQIFGLLIQLHDYFLRSEFLGVEMLQKCSLSPFSFFPCGGTMNSFLSAVL